MPKFRSLRWLVLVLLVLAASFTATRSSSAARCGSYHEGTWSGTCAGAAADCGVITVCGPPPV